MTIKYVEQLQELKRTQGEVDIQAAKTNAKIQEAKEIAMDANKPLAQRIQALKDAKKEFEGKTIQRAGKEIPAYRESISKSGVYVSPQEMEILQNRPIPLNKLETSSVSSVDAIRQWQKSDGFVVNGEGFRLNVQPMIDAATAREAAVVNETNAFRQVVKDLGIDKLNPQRREQLFNVADGVLTGVETRTSSPIRIKRDDLSLQSINTQGLYPTGEGAGYAGGILSAAVDGIRVAEAVSLAMSKTSSR